MFAQVAGAIGGLALASVNFEWIKALGINGTVAGIGALVIGYVAARLTFTHVIPAKCPKCGGRAVFNGGQPVTYHCRSCGHVHRTRVREGSRIGNQ